MRACRGRQRGDEPVANTTEENIGPAVPPHLNIWELAQVCIHGDQGMVHKFLMKVCPEEVSVL